MDIARTIRVNDLVKVEALIASAKETSEKIRDLLSIPGARSYEVREVEPSNRTIGHISANELLAVERERLAIINQKLADYNIAVGP